MACYAPGDFSASSKGSCAGSSIIDAHTATMKPSAFRTAFATSTVTAARALCSRAFAALALRVETKMQLLNDDDMLMTSCTAMIAIFTIY